MKNQKMILSAALLIPSAMAIASCSCNPSTPSSAPSTPTSAPSVEPSSVHEHSFGEWAVVTPATCTEAGEEKRSCSCGVDESRPIAALGHQLHSATLACTREGCDYDEAETYVIDNYNDEATVDLYRGDEPSFRFEVHEESTFDIYFPDYENGVTSADLYDAHSNKIVSDLPKRGNQELAAGIYYLVVKNISDVTEIMDYRIVVQCASAYHITHNYGRCVNCGYIYGIGGEEIYDETIGSYVSPELEPNKKYGFVFYVSRGLYEIKTAQECTVDAHWYDESYYETISLNSNCLLPFDPDCQNYADLALAVDKSTTVTFVDKTVSRKITEHASIPTRGTAITCTLLKDLAKGDELCIVLSDSNHTVLSTTAIALQMTIDGVRTSVNEAKAGDTVDILLREVEESPALDNAMVTLPYTPAEKK